MNKILEGILLAKDDRSKLRKDISSKSLASLSLSLNIPGYPKSTSEISEYFNNILSNLKDFLLSNRIFLNPDFTYHKIDEAGDFFISALNVDDEKIHIVKSYTEDFEQKYGRLIDVDITNSCGHPISSNKVKTCFFCGEYPAIDCMRNRRHDYEYMQNQILSYVNIFNKQEKLNDFKNKISALATESLWMEISLTPKPGLVDHSSSGSHTDMDYYSFVKSTCVISQYFSDIVNLAIDDDYVDSVDALPVLRQIGMNMEKSMYEQTNGVNTHKGGIYIMANLIYVCSYLYYHNSLSIPNIHAKLKAMFAGLVSRELVNTSFKSNGVCCYNKYGIKGIRGEMEDGLPIIFENQIEILRKFIVSDNYETISYALKRCLVDIISRSEDTNIIHRAGYEVYLEFRQKAKLTREFDSKSEFLLNYNNMISYCEEKNISPGGAADLLAASWFVYRLFEN
ncbi:MAG: triphosphoribosyl-dephospho-CoA synthase [Marinifilaceae bacterium]|jgi:holo-ACP synthase/triphosphoribosyl-dephospho-CoA synthase|nr:triphosphoribosyl-dephospho-CoA synthase [Marinifilaceae bacterium]